MPKRTLKEIAELHGITRDMLNAARNQGVNPWNDAELKAWVKKRRPRVSKNAKVEPTPPPPGEDPDNRMTIEQMEDAIRSATDYGAVKILKEKIVALRNAASLRQEIRELVPVGEVRQSITRVVSAARGELLKLSADLPPQLEGLAAAQMQTVIREGVVEILTRLSDETSSLYGHS